MPFISFDDTQKFKSRPSLVGACFLRVIFLFGSGLVMLSLVLAFLLLYRDDRNMNQPHSFIAPDPIITGATRAYP